MMTIPVAAGSSNNPFTLDLWLNFAIENKIDDDMLYEYLCPPLPEKTVTRWMTRIRRIEHAPRPRAIKAAEWQGKQNKTKGRAFERLVRDVMKSVRAFTVSHNVATTTNEIDILVQVGLSIQICPNIREWGPHFICECKLVNKAINATWVGKLNSVLELHGAGVGILISSHGAPKGQVKTQIYLHAFKTPPRVIVCISLAELQECENGRNFLKLLSTRYTEAKIGATGLITQ